MVAGEAFLEVVYRRGLVIGFADLTGCVCFGGLGVLDLAGAESTAGGDLSAVARGGRVGRDGGTSSLAISVTSWDIDDVELAAGGLLGDEFLGRIMRDMVAIYDVVVPVARAKLQGVGTLKAEGAFPGARFGGGILDLGQRKLRLVVVP